MWLLDFRPPESTGGIRAQVLGSGAGGASGPGTGHSEGPLGIAA